MHNQPSSTLEAPIEEPQNTDSKTRYFKLVVGNAPEAVNIIQKKFGSGASVQSVKQHQPKGMSKLWSSPKLEIVVKVEPKSEEEFKLPKDDSEEHEQVSAEEAFPEIDETAPPPQILNDEANPAPPHENVDPEAIPHTLTVESLMKQAGFENPILNRFETHPEWMKIKGHGAQKSLKEVVALLRQEFTSLQSEPLTTRVAFTGNASVGKSNCLRNYVANRVFVHNKKVQILKLDLDDPNADDLLKMFCEIIGIDLLRDPYDVDLSGDTEIYVDTPGLHRKQPEKIQQVKKTLDQLGIDTRIWVMISLYDQTHLSNGFAIAKEIGSTHQTFTHLDELENWVKLWKFVLEGSLPLISNQVDSQTPEERGENFLPLLLSRTFPNILQN